MDDKNQASYSRSCNVAFVILFLYGDLSFISVWVIKESQVKGALHGSK